ncbi:hypothetical protein AB0H71_01800 [Nocardia sp. NPDC050697]
MRQGEHLARAEATIDTLGDDEYGQLIREGLRTIADQLAGM